MGDPDDRRSRLTGAGRQLPILAKQGQPDGAERQLGTHATHFGLTPSFTQKYAIAL